MSKTRKWNLTPKNISRLIDRIVEAHMDMDRNSNKAATYWSKWKPYFYKRESTIAVCTEKLVSLCNEKSITRTIDRIVKAYRDINGEYISNRRKPYDKHLAYVNKREEIIKNSYASLITLANKWESEA